MPAALQSPTTSTQSKGQASSGVQRGYIAYFYWKEHYNAAYGEGTIPRPSKTELVPSIPGIFARIIGILQAVHKESTGMDVVPSLDRKIAKPATVRDKGVDKRVQFISDLEGQDYVVNACRKEHVKLIYDGPDGGMLGKLRLCPYLIDVFAISPSGNRRHCVGGPGKARFSSNVQSSYRCTCQVKFEPTIHPDLASSALNDDATMDIDDEDEGAGAEEEGTSQVTPHERADRGALGSMSPTSDSYSTIWTQLQNKINESKQAVERCWRTRAADQERSIEMLQTRVRDAEQRATEWEQKWRDERKHNADLMDRFHVLQRQIEKLTQQLPES